MLALLVPGAQAVCTQLFCATTTDADGDGVPERGSFGTTTFVHEAPVVNVVVTNASLFAGGEAYVGHEEDDPVLILPYLYAERNASGVAVLYARVDVAQLDSETGGATPVAVVLVDARDGDGDGVPERLVTRPTLP